MTKEELMEYLEEYDDKDEVDINQILREEEEARRMRIEELEERQHANGFYAFQDMIAMYRYER